MPLNADDLTPELRARLGIAAGKTRTTRRVGPYEPHHGWRCHSCGEPVPTAAAMDRHRDQRRHYRYEVVS